MQPWLDELEAWLAGMTWFESTMVTRIGAALGLMVGGWLVARVMVGAVSRLTRRRLDAQGVLVARLVTFYTVLALFAVTALQQLGVDLSVFVGAAGILTVALGFAAQTSASNVISGLFLLGERPFVVGDIIEVEGEVGEVVGFDLLSVKLRTFANLLVRVPNETMLKAKLKNLTHYPIRRFDLQLRVSHEADLTSVRKLLLDVAARYPECLDEPAPLVFFGEFEESSIRLQLSVWSATDRYYAMANAIPDLVRQALEREGIPLAVPVRRMIEL